SIRQVLDEQVERLSALERAIGRWLAVEREPVGFAELVADLGLEVERGAAVEAGGGVGGGSLRGGGAGGRLTPQPVGLEDGTTRPTATVAQEILAGEPALMANQPLLKATAKDYVRRSQERLIAQPLLERLRVSLGSAEAVERRLLELLGAWRGRA